MRINIKKVIKTSLSLFLGTGVFLFSACQIGLGEAVDLTAPEVSIESPDFMASISDDFEAKGIAVDNQAVTRLVLSFNDKQWIYENGSWSRPGASLDNGIWKVNLSLPEGSGEYVLKVTATDSMNNTGSRSVASRTVVYDKDPPKVTVTQPSKLYESTEILGTLLPTTDYKDFTYISEYYNGESLSIQGYQDEKYSLKELTIQVADSSGNVVYEKILHEDLRNWSITVPAEKLGTETKLYQIITTSIDEADNKELCKSHGFFCWWPDADKPWIETADLERTSTITETSSANYYPGYKFQGQCYDDDGIKSVIVQLYDLSDNEINNGRFEFSTENEDEMQSFFPWTIVLPETTGVVKLVATCKDKNNNTADVVTGYLNVLDITIPRLEVIEPSQTVSLFGDTKGDVTFKGIARDDSGIKSVKMVWLKDESDLLTYSQTSASEWNLASGTNDSKGNKIWEAELGPGVRDISQIEYEFSKKINIFTDLNIGTNKLTGQTFIFKVEDISGKATTTTYAVQGDIKKPEITIDKVYIKYSENEIKELTPEDSFSLPAFGENTVVKVEGTWSDDSTDVWDDKTKVSKTLKVEGLINPEITVNENKWNTDYVKNSVSGGLSIKATITDLAGSSSVAKASYAINTDEAEFEKITAANADGTYKAGDVITIQMKFTKPVIVTGNPVLKLSNGKKVKFKTSTNGTKIHEFEYVVQNGDSGSNINAEISNASSCTWKDNSSKSIVQVVVDSTNDLAYNKNIDIVTVAPTVESVELNDSGDKLKIKFSSTIYKNLGDILLTQKTVSAVPSVLTESEFKKLKNKDSRFEDYYSKTTNGCDSTGKADLKAKYVLKYEYDSKDSNLIRMYTAAKAHEIKLNVRSSNITVSGNEMVVNLTGSYALPCKGAEYIVSIPESFVTDVVGNKNEEDKTKTVIMPGVEDPVIRVSTGFSSFNTSSLTATQPLTSEFKIDCETPNANIKYGINSRSYEYTYHCETHDQTRDNGAEDSDENRYTSSSASREYDSLVYANMDLGVGADGIATSCPYPLQGTSPEEPSTLDKTYSRAVKIGSDSWTCGEKYLIATQAKAGEITSTKSYATANRSLFVFNNNNGVGCNTESNQRIWLRGGDSETGGVMTAGFPLSWSPENDKPGIALMTQDSTNEALWYYLTWELNTTAYVGVVRGEADASSGTKGAVKDTEVFGVNAWVPFKKWYCVYPGESRVVETKRYESVYGKHRDFFKWNEVSSGASEDDDTEKMTVHATMNAGYSKSEVAFDCTDEWQKTKIKKWGGDISSEGAYLIVTTEASSTPVGSPYVDVWSYDYGSRVVVAKRTNITPGETIKIKFGEAESNRWKYDDLYVGGLGVKITSVQMYNYVRTYNLPQNVNAVVGAKYTFETSAFDRESLLSDLGLTSDDNYGKIKFIDKNPDTVTEGSPYVKTLDESDSNALRNGNKQVLTYGFDIISWSDDTAYYHPWTWQAMDSENVKEGVILEFTVSKVDSAVADDECFIICDNVKGFVTGSTVQIKLTADMIRNKNWQYTNNGQVSVSGYGVTITNRTIKDPYFKKRFTGQNWYPGYSLTVKFSKNEDFDIEDNDLKLLFYADNNLNETHQITSSELLNGEYLAGSDLKNGWNTVCGYGVKITDIIVDGNSTMITE